MKDGARPDPLAAAQRVKDLARDYARDLAQELASGVRRSTRYVRLRAAIVGSFAVLGAIAIWASCPASARTNALGARVQLLSESLVGTQLRVINASDRIWTEVALTVDGGFRWEKRTIRPGDDLVIALGKFEKDGLPPPGALKPSSMTIECEQGHVVVSPIPEELAP
jgi:hypothetical protein